MSAKLVLIRHGQSVWNAENRFTGWVDVPLAERGWQEAESAGRKLAGIKFDVAFTSHLQRAICTLQTVLRFNSASQTAIFMPADGTVPQENYQPADNEMQVHIHHTELAERHYGDLQGLNKDEVLAEHGPEQFKKWRRGFDTPPPNGESLKNTCDRVVPFFEQRIEPLLREGRSILIAAHGNSLRALTKHLEGISDDEIVKVEIPTGTPIIYQLSAHAEGWKIDGKEVINL
ncbi:MAG: 2,3-diphosphoglycerate-dependent phosphoglycerate mutase [Gammaproteobacteria bacterium]